MAFLTSARFFGVDEDTVRAKANASLLTIEVSFVKSHRMILKASTPSQKPRSSLESARFPARVVSAHGSLTLLWPDVPAGGQEGHRGGQWGR